MATRVQLHPPTRLTCTSIYKPLMMQQPTTYCTDHRQCTHHSCLTSNTESLHLQQQQQQQMKAAARYHQLNCSSEGFASYWSTTNRSLHGRPLRRVSGGEWSLAIINNTFETPLISQSSSRTSVDRPMTTVTPRHMPRQRLHVKSTRSGSIIQVTMETSSAAEPVMKLSAEEFDNNLRSALASAETAIIQRVNPAPQWQWNIN